MRLRLDNVAGLIVVSLISLVQTYVLREHINVGDGIFYRDTFESLRGAGILDSYILFQNGLGASELFSFLIFYIFAQFIEYLAFVYLSNLAFCLTIYFLYRKYGKHLGYYLLTVPLNYYFLAACFGAQRLKLGLMFFFLAVIASTSGRARGWLVLSIFSHFQIIILYVAERVRGAFAAGARLPWMEMFLLGALAVAAFITVPLIQFKVLTYVLERGEINLATFVGSCAIAAYVSRFDIGVVAEFVFFLLLILIIGESRVNILVFCVLWRMIFLNRSQPATISYMVAFYLCCKGAIFTIDVAAGGTGFGAP